MDRIIIGNALSLIGAILMACIGLLKKRKQILTVQCVQFGIMGMANLVLGGITGRIGVYLEEYGKHPMPIRRYYRKLDY